MNKRRLTEREKELKSMAIIFMATSCLFIVFLFMYAPIKIQVATACIAIMIAYCDMMKRVTEHGRNRYEKMLRAKRMEKFQHKITQWN